MFKKLKEKWDSINKECLKDALIHSAFWMAIFIGGWISIVAILVLMGLYPILIPIILGSFAFGFFLVMVKEHYKDTITRY